jgi:hypothetical protein
VVTFTCGGCADRWSGLSRAHCGACHRTFNGSGLFDKHRQRGRCVDPAELLLNSGYRAMYQTDGVWSSVEDRQQPTPPRKKP